MTSNIAKTPVITCPVYKKEVVAGCVILSGHTLITKSTSCCGLFKTAHFICAEKCSIKLNKDYKFDSKTYKHDTSSPLFCMNYNVFIVVKTHKNVK